MSIVIEDAEFATLSEIQEDEVELAGKTFRCSW